MGLAFLMPPPLLSSLLALLSLHQETTARGPRSGTVDPSPGQQTPWPGSQHCARMPGLRQAGPLSQLPVCHRTGNGSQGLLD